jgi:hypothetical protein
MVSGFLVPRLIDRNLGQDALGIWDFAWSLVVYFNLVQMGIIGSISRSVAFHRAQRFCKYQPSGQFRRHRDAIPKSIMAITKLSPSPSSAAHHLTEHQTTAAIVQPLQGALGGASNWKATKN